MTNIINDEQHWDIVIVPHVSLFRINYREIWRYRDLLWMFVKREFVTYYKQTILGPLWFFLQPLFTTIIYIFVFGRVAQLSTDGIPHALFYMSGVVLWNYFADCFNKTATVFRDNQNLFGKVYFPRLIVPLSIIVTNLIKLSIQFILFLMVYTYFLFVFSMPLRVNVAIFLLPILILLMASISLGLGLIITSLTTKYRDLVFLLHFGVQLLMYATPVIYPLSSLPEKYRWLIAFNPLTPIIETFRYGMLGAGTFAWVHMAYTVFFSLFILIAGIVIFNKTEKKFIDMI